MFKTIYVDMDGVLADFEKHADTLMGGTLSSQPKKMMWSTIKNHIKSGGRFWYELEMMDRVNDMMDSIIATGLNVEILTACGYEDTSAPDKRDWIANHFPGIRVNFVRSSKDKALYAESSAILIDDREKSIGPWVKAGGVGILHTDAISTTHKLADIMDDPTLAI